ncbi:MAG TPA: hypothetical protein DGV23_06155 [Stenotrophomonas sp.]|nr:hypothetical protein [Stenotrophomonas sp.]
MVRISTPTASVAIDARHAARAAAQSALGDAHGRQTTPARAVCRIPVHTSPLLARGLDVTCRASAGRITDVSVERAVWLGY